MYEIKLKINIYKIKYAKIAVLLISRATNLNRINLVKRTIVQNAVFILYD